jgi:hypothetical protein
MANLLSVPFSGDKYLAETFLTLRDLFNIKTVIETGTYKGATTLWLNEHFEDVHTTEIDERLYPELRKTFKGTNIKLWCAGSEEALPEILAYISDKQPLIFIDAHWYKNPVLAELKAIAEAGIKPIIAIHDFKVPNYSEFGYDTYPQQGITYEWQWIEKHIESIYGKGGYEYFYNEKAEGDKRGCVFIYPKI